MILFFLSLQSFNVYLYGVAIHKIHICWPSYVQRPIHFFKTPAATCEYLLNVEFNNFQFWIHKTIGDTFHLKWFFSFFTCVYECLNAKTSGIITGNKFNRFKRDEANTYRLVSLSHHYYNLIGVLHYSTIGQKLVIVI